jgi:hypothetical protein
MGEYKETNRVHGIQLFLNILSRSLPGIDQMEILLALLRRFERKKSMPARVVVGKLTRKCKGEDEEGDFDIFLGSFASVDRPI